MSIVLRKVNGDDYYKTFRDMQREIDNVFSGFLTNGQYTGRKNCCSPNVDVYETDKSYILEFELPGFSKEDIKINLEENVLSVESEKKFEEEKKDRNYHIVERKFGSFKRQFTIPENGDRDSVNAKFKDGILEITIDKKQEEAKEKTKSIEIE